jgi:AcrR family transcriptional regulator
VGAGVVTKRAGPVAPAGAAPAGGPGADGPRRRDAAETRRRLLHAGRRRFALHGYERTTLRQIAADAGVNLALIKRYFGSKEGLFEAALAAAPEQLTALDGIAGDRARLAEVLSRELSANAWPETGENPILLLLRTTGDPRSDTLRRQGIQAYAERLLRAAGYAPGLSAPGQADADQPDRDIMLRAYLVIALGAGVAALRAAIGVQPLGAATAEDLRGPLTDVIAALLPPEKCPPGMT